MAKPPNILWICTDQQRHDTLGCYGNEWVRTPNIDALAAGGTLFENVFCQSPVCTPSRASFLTGRYPRTNRTRMNGQSIPEDEVLVTKLLRDQADYDCGLAGKLHLSACAAKVCPEVERRIDDGYDEFHWSHHPDCEWPGNEYCQWLRDKGCAYHFEPFEGSEHVQVSMPAELHQTTWCAEKAVDFLKARQGVERPWLFSVNIFDPHHRFDPPREYLERYLDKLDDIPLPDYRPGELGDRPRFQAMDHRGAHNGGGAAFDAYTDRDHRLTRAAYWAMCDLIDDQVGRIVAALDETGQREDTLVIFMSDHGEMLGDHGIYLKGPYFYEQLVHVPLVVNMPGTVAAGVRRRSLVELLDLAPTLLEAAGVERFAGMQGRSLWPLLTDAAHADAHRDSVYCEYYNAMPWHGEPGPWTTMLRTDRHKLTVEHHADEGELYDLAADPGEHDNLFHDPAHMDVKLRLLKTLCDRMALTADPLPPRRAAF